MFGRQTDTELRFPVTGESFLGKVLIISCLRSILTIFLIVVAGHNALGVNDSGYEVFRIFSASLFLLSMIPVAFELAEVCRDDCRLCIESFCMLLFLAALVLLTLIVDW